MSPAIVWIFGAVWLAMGIAGVLFRLWTCPLDQAPFNTYGYNRPDPFYMFLAAMAGPLSALVSVLQWTADVVHRARIERERVAEIAAAEAAKIQAEVGALLKEWARP